MHSPSPTRLVEFEVRGALPPKKDGASSMWKKPSEQVALRALRLAAHAAAKHSDWRLPFEGRVRLEMVVHLPCVRRQGDLDNFVTGVCDGLQACVPGTQYDAQWDDGAPAIHPTKPLVFLDDDQVHEIVARKVYLPTEDEKPRYTIRVVELHEASPSNL